MKNVIQKIMQHQQIDEIFKCAISDLYTEGPISVTTLEILSYLYLYEFEKFQEYNPHILKYMGLSYKNIKTAALPDIVFGMYEKYIQSEFQYSYTPVQANIVKSIEQNKCFSFSAPTSTGKSYVFRNIISSTNKDVVIIVPSRALINEYYFKITEAIPNKNVNILTFIDKINTKHANRNIFIVTPERCKELFKHKNDFDIEYFLFDEAQLSNESSNRGLYFDSIVRRIQSSYPDAKFIFAHPFVSNPEAQIKKNHFDENVSMALQYKHKNVGQIFYAYDNEKYYHFGIDKEIMGNRKIECSFDPIEKALNNNGSVLIYTTKSSIYNRKVFTDFKKYIDQCTTIKDREANKIIEQVKNYLGANETKEKDMYSNLICLLRRGIVVHHGSLPLQARLLLEQFTQRGFCRICFATSTLEQGINMPFEVVFLNTFQASRPLSLKNLIGRAGRSSTDSKFDYGSIIVKTNCMSNLRDILLSNDVLKEVSLLEEDNIDEDQKDFKDAILSGTLSDEYNLTENQIEILSDIKAQEIIGRLLDAFFIDDNLVSLKSINSDDEFKLELYSLFEQLYSFYLKRDLSAGEKGVFNTAIKIMIWKIHCKTFKDICFYRYAYASKMKRRKELQEKIKNSTGISKSLAQLQLNNLYAAFISGCSELPDKNLPSYSMFGYNEIKAIDVDYDRIVFDTYDYLDKTIGFYLSDIFYTAFKKYYETTKDIRADKLSKYVKYGTDNERQIWMLRYGLTFEDIEWADKYIAEINEEEIVFNTNVNELEKEKYTILERFIS